MNTLPYRTHIKKLIKKTQTNDDHNQNGEIPSTDNKDKPISNDNADKSIKRKNVDPLKKPVNKCATIDKNDCANEHELNSSLSDDANKENIKLPTKSYLKFSNANVNNAKRNLQQAGLTEMSDSKKNKL